MKNFSKDKNITKKQGLYIALGGVLFFAISKTLYSVWPNLIMQSIATIAELTWFIFVGIGLLIAMRKKGGNNKDVEGKQKKEMNSSQKKQEDFKSEKVENFNGGKEINKGSSLRNASNNNNKTLRGALMLGILAVSLAICFYFIYLPLRKEYNLKKCLENSEETYDKKKDEIDSHIKSLEKKKEVAEKEAKKELKKFNQNNPKPKKEDYPAEEVKKPDSFLDKIRKESGASTSSEYTSAMISYKMKRDKIFEELNKVKDKIELIKTDYEKIKENRKKRDERCFKLYK